CRCAAATAAPSETTTPTGPRSSARSTTSTIAASWGWRASPGRTPPSPSPRRCGAPSPPHRTPSPNAASRPCAPWAPDRISIEGASMSTHPVTLFTGQWADLPFEEVARLASEWGYDGLEIAASGDHLDLRRADEDDSYVASRREILDRHGLKVYAISNHLAGQAVCDAPIDFRHQAILRE